MGASFIEAIYRESYKPPLVQTIAEWGAKNFVVDQTSPLPGRYDVSNSPYMAEPLAVFQDERYRQQVTVGPNQGGRTKGMEVAALWTVVNRPGPTQWNSDTNDSAADFAEERFWPTADLIEEVRKLYPSNHQKKRNRKVIWQNGYAYILQGANETNAQQKTVLNQFNDEIYKWAEGMLMQFHKRTTALEWSRKVWDSSVAGDEGGQWDNRWQASSMAEWSFRCPYCGKLQPFIWEQVIWDTNSITKPKGEWDLDEVEKTVRYHCNNDACKHRYDDTSRSRRAMNEASVYVHARPERKLRGHRFNCLAVNWPGIKWSKWVSEFLSAKMHFKQFGDPEQLKQFWTRRMALFWEEGKYTGGTVTIRSFGYEMGAPNIWKQTKWDGEEWGRFLSCDKQDYGYPYVLRACKDGGASRLLSTGVLSSYDEIQGTAAEFGVKPHSVLIDCSYEMREVFAQAVRRGWTCFRGSPKENFLHLERRDGKVIKILRPYSSILWGDAGLGANKSSQQFIHKYVAKTREYARVFEWSNLSIKNMLDRLRKGRSSIIWETPDDAPQDYFDELNGDTRYTKLAQNGRKQYFWSNAGRNGKSQKKPNHRLDCECQILTAMIMQRLIDLEQFSTEVEEGYIEEELDAALVPG